LGLVRICGLLGFTRQAFYQHFWYQEELSVEHRLVLDEVQKIRARHRVIGTRKLYVMLQPFLLEHQIKLGRDALFTLMAENYLLVRRRRKPTQTTFSRHWMKKYCNLIAGLDIIHTNQVWVSDITYLRTEKGFVYISLITDAYSRRIMGYHVADNLETVHSVKALQMALTGAPRKSLAGLIHHSDRGVQYCSNSYVNLLQDYDIQISMTNHGDPLENAIAERINGIIKNEYLEQFHIRDRKHTEELLQIAVNLYNTERPHMSTSMLAPQMVYTKNLKVNREWKNYYLNKTILTNKQPVKL
jgi:transposase InsO family protein